MGPDVGFVEMSAGFSFVSICAREKYFRCICSKENVTGISRCRDRGEILFWEMMLIEALLSP